MNKFLVVVLDKVKPGLILAPENRDKVMWQNRELNDTGIRTLIGFFDWLRTDSKKVIGVRLTVLDEELEYLIPELARPNYVQELPKSIGVEIFFSQERQYNPSNSDDQDFMDNWIYRSDDGLLGVSFNTQYSIDSLMSNTEIQLCDV